jgi:hypothetical protein
LFLLERHSKIIALFSRAFLSFSTSRFCEKSRLARLSTYYASVNTLDFNIGPHDLQRVMEGVDKFLSAARIRDSFLPVR